MSMVRVREADVKNDRDSDREDRDKRNREDRDNVIEMQHISYKSLSGVQKDVHGFIEMTEPKKPNSKIQKYRKLRK